MIRKLNTLKDSVTSLPNNYGDSLKSSIAMKIVLEISNVTPKLIKLIASSLNILPMVLKSMFLL